MNMKKLKSQFRNLINVLLSVLAWDARALSLRYSNVRQCSNPFESRHSTTASPIPIETSPSASFRLLRLQPPNMYSLHHTLLPKGPRSNRQETGTNFSVRSLRLRSSQQSAQHRTYSQYVRQLTDPAEVQVQVRPGTRYCGCSDRIDTSRLFSTLDSAGEGMAQNTLVSLCSLSSDAQTPRAPSHMAYNLPAAAVLSFVVLCACLLVDHG